DEDLAEGRYRELDLSWRATIRRAWYKATSNVAAPRSDSSEPKTLGPCWTRPFQCSDPTVQARLSIESSTCVVGKNAGRLHSSGGWPSTTDLPRQNVQNDCTDRSVSTRRATMPRSALKSR